MRAALVQVLFLVSAAPLVSQQVPHHYVFFNRDRERIAESSFLDTPKLEGAQLKYTWRELEPEPGVYDFSPIEHDLTFLTEHGKKLFIQLQDVSFDTSIVNVPRYLRRDPQFGGGVAMQYTYERDDESDAQPEGWVALRWNPAVQERIYALFVALGAQFDGRIEGITLPETAVEFGRTGRLFPPGYTPERYRDAVLENMRVLKRAFPRSVAMLYANFMPGEVPGGDHSLLRSVYAEAWRTGVAVGGPDLLPTRRGQMRNSYPLLRQSAGKVPSGIAVQWGNYEQVDPATGRRMTVQHMLDFAEQYLQVTYVFWGTQEPYYTDVVIPLLRGVDR
jgi:hypothetical protein